MTSPAPSIIPDVTDLIDRDLTIAALSSERTTREQTPDNAEEDEIKDEEQHISFRGVDRVNVSVRNLAITVSPHSVGLPWSRKTQNAEEIRILDNVSADFPAGELTAIIGGSGSGKVCIFCLPT